MKIIKPESMKFSSPDLAGLYAAFMKSDRVCLGHEGLGQLVLILASICNMECRYCYEKRGLFATQRKKLMSASTAINAIEATLAQFGDIRSIKYFGGEPTLNASVMFVVCEHFRRLRIENEISRLPYFGMVSNLAELSGDVVDTIRDYDINVTVSLDGPQEINDKLRILPDGRGTNSIVRRNVDYLLKTIDKPITVECVYTPLHYEQGFSPADLYRYFYSLGITETMIHPLVSQHGYFSAFPAALLAGFVSNLRNLQKEYVFEQVCRLWKTKNSSNFTVQRMIRDLRHCSYNHCNIGQSNFTVDTDGWFWPCYFLVGQEPYLLRSTKGTRFPVHSGFQRTEQHFKSLKKTDIQICKHCDIVKGCHACLAEMIQPDGRIEPNRIVCEANMGAIEGLLEGMAWVGKNEGM